MKRVTSAVVGTTGGLLISGSQAAVIILAVAIAAAVLLYTAMAAQAAWHSGHARSDTDRADNGRTLRVLGGIVNTCG